jgi:hypothetical protein
MDYGQLDYSQAYLNANIDEICVMRAPISVREYDLCDFLLLPVKSNPMKINTGTYYTVTGKYIPSCIIYSGEKKYSFPDRCER